MRSLKAQRRIKAPEYVERVRKALTRSHTRSARSNSTEPGISTRSVWRMVH